MEKTTAKITIEAGLLVRNQFRALLEKEKFIRDNLEIEYTEIKGFLSSQFLIKLTGKETVVRVWEKALENFLNDLN